MFCCQVGWVKAVAAQQYWVRIDWAFPCHWQGVQRHAIRDGVVQVSIAIGQAVAVAVVQVRVSLRKVKVASWVASWVTIL